MGISPLINFSIEQNGQAHTLPIKKEKAKNALDALIVLYQTRAYPGYLPAGKVDNNSVRTFLLLLELYNISYGCYCLLPADQEA